MHCSHEWRAPVATTYGTLDICDTCGATRPSGDAS